MMGWDPRKSDCWQRLMEWIFVLHTEHTRTGKLTQTGLVLKGQNWMIEKIVWIKLSSLEEPPKCKIIKLGTYEHKNPSLRLTQINLFLSSLLIHFENLAAKNFQSSVDDVFRLNKRASIPTFFNDDANFASAVKCVKICCRLICWRIFIAQSRADAEVYLWLLLEVAAVAQLVKRTGLRSLKRVATELTWVWFPVGAKEVGKIRTIYEASIEVSAWFRK